MSKYFPKTKSWDGKVKVEWNLSNCAPKTDSRNASGIDASSFAKKVDFTGLKSIIDKLDIDKPKNFPTNFKNLNSKVDKLDVDTLVPGTVDLIKLSDVVKNGAVKKDAYNAKTKNIEKKIPDITNLATKTTLNAKINKVKSERASTLT